MKTRWWVIDHDGLWLTVWAYTRAEARYMYGPRVKRCLPWWLRWMNWLKL